MSEKKLKPNKIAATRSLMLISEMTFTERVRKIIKQIPRGKVTTYGQIAAYVGDPRGARQVVRILHACSDKDKLPWQRVINRKGEISLPRNRGYEIQKSLLQKEGVAFDIYDRIDLDKYMWRVRKFG